MWTTTHAALAKGAPEEEEEEEEGEAITIQHPGVSRENYFGPKGRKGKMWESEEKKKERQKLGCTKNEGKKQERIQANILNKSWTGTADERFQQRS